MECNAHNIVKEPCLYLSDSIITDVNFEFIDFTGFTREELLGKSILELGSLLKINSNLLFENYPQDYECYIFTKSYEVKEVNISYVVSECKNQSTYYFKEKAISTFQEVSPYIEQLLTDNKIGVAIHSIPDLVLLKVNYKYLSFQDSHNNSIEKSIGKKFKDRVNMFEGSEAEEVFKEVIRTGKAYYCDEVEYEGFERGITYWDSTIIPISTDGKAKYIVETVSEVTEKVLSRKILQEQNKEIEEQKEFIKKQREQLEAIIENIAEGVSIFDAKGEYILSNKSFRDMAITSYEYMEKLGDVYEQSEFYDIKGERITLENSPGYRVLNGERFKKMRNIIKLPNKTLHIDISGTPIYDSEGNFSLGVLSYRDMTDYFNYEEAITSRYEFLNRMIFTFDLPVVRLSCPDLKIVAINKKAFSIIELLKPNIKSIKKIKGFSIEDLFKAFKESEYYQCISEVIKEKKTKYLKKKNHMINGKEIYCNVIFEPMIAINGKIEEILILIIDVTNEIKSGLAIEKMMKLQEEFFANISHELKTPLNVIYSTTQLLNMYCESGSLDERKVSIIKYIDSIKQNSYRLSKLINNIVDISKIEAGFFDLNLSNNNIVEVVEEVVMSITDFIEIKGLNIIFDTDTEEKIIACDPEKIERIILNLISNAIKFSDEGNEIFVAIKDKDEYVEISVKDNGIGIEADKLDMIFERFKQVDKSLSRNAEGTGIGLNLVKSIVELHRGSIYVESEFGKGSKFTVILPAKKVMQENMILSSKMRNRSESIRVEFSDVYI